MDLEKRGSSIKILYGYPLELFAQLINKYPIHTVYANHDYEPYAIKRDGEIKTLLGKKSVLFKTFKDQVIFEKNEIVKDNGDPYLVFSPYSRKWLSQVRKDLLDPFESASLHNSFFQIGQETMPSLEEMGFIKDNCFTGSIEFKESAIAEYDKTRNFPSMAGTSMAGIHLRFGTMSIRKLVSTARNHNTVYLNELIWREFFMQLLWRQPRLVTESFKPEYDNIQWRNSENEFERWCKGETGFPLVDAGMRELNKTGFMHNRVRMVTASFLVKHLLIDWRWGEAYFARKLLDYDLAANNGNWQWVAGCGCDASPYFRIFNPHTQAKKFDPENKYINKWIPELNSFDYPKPMIDHAFARERCIRTFRKALEKKGKKQFIKR